MQPYYITEVSWAGAAKSSVRKSLMLAASSKNFFWRPLMLARTNDDGFNLLSETDMEFAKHFKKKMRHSQWIELVVDDTT